MRVKEGDLTARFMVNTRDELAELADSFNVMVSGMREKEELRHEMITGKIIQEKLLPASDQLTRENRIVFSYRYYPMLGIGGDYIDYLYRSDESVIILNGDVSSHGVSAGLVMTMVRTIIHIMAQKGIPLEDIAKEINKILHRDTPSNMFITLFLVDFNPKTKKMDYISCGHNIPFLLRSSGVERLPAGGMALGALPPMIYDKSVKKLSVDMKDGDILVQYTDGLTEATSPDGKMYEDDRLEKILQEIRGNGIYDPERILDLISADLKQYSGKNLDKDGFSELDDDVALIVFKVIS
jgi:serine phosphatase RsbU (regulator of sigma subunit)